MDQQAQQEAAVRLFAAWFSARGYAFDCWVDQTPAVEADSCWHTTLTRSDAAECNWLLYGNYEDCETAIADAISAMKKNIQTRHEQDERQKRQAVTATIRDTAWHC